MTADETDTGRMPARGEPRPARAADHTGFAARAGVRIAFRVYDNPGRPTVLLMPTWSIVSSRFWKLQVPYLARHYRVVTFDGRGSGASDRPVGAAAYADAEYVADTLAVLDATATERAVLVSLSRGATWSVSLAAARPDRVDGLVAIAPACGLAVHQAEREEFAWNVRHATTEGWAKYNRHHWLTGGYDDFVTWFVDRMFPEPHSTKQIEDCVGWARDVAPRTLVDATAGALRAEAEPFEDVCARVGCPVLVLHGTDDRIRTHAIGERLATLTGGSLVLLDGSGHGVPARDPVRINLLIKQFVDTVHPVATAPARPRTRRPRALYLSSPIGLGHARRDLAVAGELRALRPDLRIDWLAQHPITRVLDPAGERIHPASAFLAGESSHVEHEAGEHDLHAFEAIRRMDEILVNNFMVFNEVVESERYDLVIGDEAWDLDYFLHENPHLKRFAFAWLTDFVGWLPMPEGGSREPRLTADLNAEMIEQRARLHRVRDRSVFVGNREDVVDASFGPGPAGHSRVDGRELRLRGLRHRVRAAGRRRARDGAPRIGLPAGRAAVRGHRRRVGGGGVVAAPGARRRARRPRTGAGAAVPGRRRTAHRPGVAARAPRCVGPRLRAGAAPHARRVRSRGGAGRPDDLHGADRHRQTVHLRAAAPPLRAERPRPAPPGALPGGPVPDLRPGREPDRLAAAIAEELTRPTEYRPVETDGAARAAALLADLV